MEHYMVVKFNKSVDARELCDEIRDLFSRASDIEGVRKAEVFLSSFRLKNRYDMMIRIRMRKSAIKEFENSSVYRTWEEKYVPLIDELTVFDS